LLSFIDRLITYKAAGARTQDLRLKRPQVPAQVLCLQWLTWRFLAKNESIKWLTSGWQVNDKWITSGLPLVTDAKMTQIQDHSIRIFWFDPPQVLLHP
jgi:hypothetical protein